MNHVSAIRTRIEEHRAVLVNITNVSDLFLTELVGEEVLEESTKEDILDGRKRTEINKRFFDWLCRSDDLSVYETFFLKLREYGQKHIENLLLGITTGGLPLSPTVRRNLQRIMGELTRNIDLNSGLLENLQRIEVIGEIDCQKIGAESTKIDQAKSLWDVLLRGSDVAFENFKGEIVKTQPEMIKLIEQQDGAMNKPHVDLLRKHFDVLARCTDVNLLTIAFLQSKRVIDGGMADSLKSTDELVKKTNQVYSLLMSKPKDIFESYLRVMQENEQKHVANLLMEKSSGQQPLSGKVYERIVEIKPNLIIGIHQGVHLISAIRGYRETVGVDTDFAISQNDYEVLTEKYVTSMDKNSALVDAVLRRTEFSLKSLETALRETKQDHMADFLKEGIMFGADVKTTRTDKEEAIVNLLNEKKSQSSEEPVSDEDRQLNESFEELNMLNIPVIAANVSNSIMIYTYCRRPCDADRYVQFLKSGGLQASYEKILNLLLKIIEQENYQPLEAAVILEDKERNIIQEFINGSPTMDTGSPPDESSPPPDGKLPDVSPSCVEEGRRSDVDIVLKREKLQEDLKLIGSCRSMSVELKAGIVSKQANFVRQIEESEATVRKKCEDLKEKVENFKRMLLKDQEKFKEHTLAVMAEQIRSLESYASVVSDCEGRVRRLMQHGTSAEICKSFALLHERAEKLHRLSRQPPSNAVEIFGGLSQLPPLISILQEESRQVEISEKLVFDQRDFLIEYLDPESGLLEQLVLIRALSQERAAEIGKLSSYREKNKELLDIIFRDNKFKELVFSLAATNQGHLVNYLESQGKHDPKFGQNWPVTDLEREKLDLMRDQLPCLFAPNNITWMCFMNVINLRHRDLIFSKPSLEEKCDTLLEILKRGRISDVYKIENLLATYQVQPQLKPLDQHREFLGQCLDPDSGLFDALKPCLSAKQMKSIKHERSIEKSNLKLVDIISGSDKYDEFIKALSRTGQTHIANYLNANGVYNPKFAGEWPAVFSKGWVILQANRNLLVDKLRLRDFLDGLLSANVISSTQKDVLLQIQSKRDRNEKFLDMLGRGTIDNYNKAIEYFRASKQIEVAQWLGLPLVPVFGGFQVQVQVQQVNVEKEVAELFSAFGEVAAFRPIGPQ